jgi:hypothetical protein
MTYSDALWGNASGDVGVKSPSVTGSHLWRMKYLRYSKTNLLLNFKPVTCIWKKKTQFLRLGQNLPLSYSLLWGSLFFIAFQLFVSWTFFFQIRVTGLKFNKRFFFQYRKYFICQRWLPEDFFTKLRKGTKMLRNKLRKALVMKLPSYDIVTPPIGIIYYDV